MLIENQHPNNKSIMVAVVGAPNVGKSSLINYLMGVDLSVVTSKAQTTRNKFHCVFTIDHTEVILVDTPGIHSSNLEINKRMNKQALDGTLGADLNLLLIDMTRDIFPQFESFQNRTSKKEGFKLGPISVVFTKSDRVERAEDLPLDQVIIKAKTIIPEILNYFVISSKTGDGIHILNGAICDVAKEGPHHYKEGKMSNKNERFFVTEYIREQLFLNLKEELPYEVAVTIDEYSDEYNKEKKQVESAKISATILVNRPSQRGIVVGKQGAMIKEIGTNARIRIEELLGFKVFLKLHVKVSPKWFKNNMVLEELGLFRAEDSARVWHSK
jgi:GTP-binding protein Era